ncbi:hypothetical protein H0H93_013656 [Arthromyces matolae]|nr:hypothetical protein H0H93_013656 [Arthromyces matolae]
MASSTVRPTNYPAIKNAPLVGLAEGNGAFNNLHLAISVVVVPYLLKSFLPLVNRGGFKTYLFLLVLTGVPTTVAYWTLVSMYGPRRNEKVVLPGKDIDTSSPFSFPTSSPTPGIRTRARFANTTTVRSRSLDLRVFILKLFIFLGGDDFYEWFLGPRMIYTSGVCTDNTVEQSLEVLQDNKLAIVCEKLDLKPTDKLLDIGCGWGTLVTYAAKNYGCDATGCTLSVNQAGFGTERIKKNGVASEKARIICSDYRDLPVGKGAYTKIVSLEMAEHVGIRRYSQFLSQVYDLLDDDGIFVFQVAGIRPPWQFEDLIWGLFMNKYVFPGADASCSLGWVVNKVFCSLRTCVGQPDMCIFTFLPPPKLEGAGFEIKNIDVLGVHYSATIYQWYKNWVSNKDKVVAKYGDRWYRVWVFFLAYSVITSRQGGASVFQITMHKNLNAFHRIEGVPKHASIHVKPVKEPLLVE